MISREESAGAHLKNPFRFCGGCTACCTAMGVRELTKPAGAVCPHCESGVGCSLYPKRPNSCASFRCQWLLGFGKHGDRPDISGAILDFVAHEEGLPGGILQIWEVHEGGFVSPLAQQASESALSCGIWVSRISLSGKKILYQPKYRHAPKSLRRRIRQQGFAFVAHAPGRISDIL